MPRCRRSSRRTHLLSVGVGLLATLTLLLVAAPAQAHDELIATNPANRAQVSVMPASIVLTFEEPAERIGSQVIVRGPSGNVAVGRPVFSGSKVTQAVRPDAPAGRYTVLWRVTSDDGHPVSGSFAFTAAAAASAPTTSAPSSPTTTTDAAAPSASTPTSGQSPSGSSSSRWIVLVVVLVLLVPVALFIRRGRRLSPGTGPS